jgi:hypothetical protein
VDLHDELTGQNGPIGATPLEPTIAEVTHAAAVDAAVEARRLQLRAKFNRGEDFTDQELAYLALEFTRQSASAAPSPESEEAVDIAERVELFASGRAVDPSDSWRPITEMVKQVVQEVRKDVRAPASLPPAGPRVAATPRTPRPRARARKSSSRSPPRRRSSSDDDEEHDRLARFRRRRRRA